MTSTNRTENVNLDVQPLEQHMHQHHDAWTEQELRKIALDTAVSVSVNRAASDPAFHASHLSLSSILGLADGFDAYLTHGTVPEEGDENA